MGELTKRQNEVLHAIATIWRQGRAPTTGELLRALNLKGESGLSVLLRPLNDKGFIDITGGVHGRQRLIELTSRGRAQAGLGIPILGEIPAGPLQEAIQHSDEWLEGVGSLLKWQEHDFLLRVQGDSMTGAGILPGDYVQLRPNIEVRSGEIVAAQICDDGNGRMEATLKYLDFVLGVPIMRLRAANPAYPDREVEANCLQVAGVFRGLIRTNN